MLFSPIVERFAQKAPLSMMARVLLEFALAPDDLDKLFGSAAETQYERKFLFSSLVDLMTVVVTKVQPSLRAAYLAVADTLPASLSALYEKLAHTEMVTQRALALHVFQRLSSVVQALGVARPEPIAGYRLLLLDGNHLAATQHRLASLWEVAEAPLPGQALVVYQPTLDLIKDLFPCEDGHANERSLLDQVLATIEPFDLWVADRNFCTIDFLLGLAKRDAAFVIRHHAGLPILSAGTLRAQSSTETGEVFEQQVTVGTADGRQMNLRRIVMRLRSPTRDGDHEIALLSNLPAEHDAASLARLYRGRWTIETMFQKLTEYLASEIDTMAYPRAALLGFVVATAAFNVLQTVLASLRHVHGSEKVDEEVSGYYVANEVRRYHEGQDGLVEEEEWVPFRTMSVETLVGVLTRWAGQADLRKYPKSTRGPKKPAKERKKEGNSPHTSTAAILLRQKGKTAP